MYRLNYFSPLTFLVILFAVAGCTDGANLSPYPNPSTALPILETISNSDIYPSSLPPTSVPTLISPTPIQLPQIDGSIGEYCSNQEPVFLPIAEAQGLTDDDIAEKLMSLYLDYYNKPEAPGYCRIDGYRVEEVSYEERLASLPLEPKGDFLRGVSFLIKLSQVPNQWMGFGGEIDQENWLHTGMYLAVFRTEDGYTMKFAHP